MMGSTDAAAKMAKVYLEMAIPVSAKDKREKLMSQEEQLKSLEKTGYYFKPILERGAKRKPGQKASKTPGKAAAGAKAPPVAPDAPVAPSLWGKRDLARPTAPQAPQAPRVTPQRQAGPATSFPKGRPGR